LRFERNYGFLRKRDQVEKIDCRANINTNAEIILTFGSIAPSPLPLPTGERGRVRGGKFKTI
jgi:hypothetical protein